MIYLKISLSDSYDCVCCSHEWLFFTQARHPLVLAFCSATLASTIFALTWPFEEMEGLGGKTVFVWLYCTVCFFIQDVFSLHTAVLDKFLRSRQTQRNAQSRNKKNQEPSFIDSNAVVISVEKARSSSFDCRRGNMSLTGRLPQARSTAWIWQQSSPHQCAH